MPSVTTPGLRTAPAGVQLRAVTQGYCRPGGIDILDSTLDRVLRFVGVVAPRGGELRL